MLGNHNRECTCLSQKRCRPCQRFLINDWNQLFMPIYYWIQQFMPIDLLPDACQFSPLLVWASGLLRRVAIALCFQGYLLFSACWASPRPSWRYLEASSHPVHDDSSPLPFWHTQTVCVVSQAEIKVKHVYSIQS